MKLKNHILILFALVSLAGHAQKSSRADQAFFEYDFKTAIAEYVKEGRKQPLSPGQQLNLAEAYFRQRQYQEAADQYVELYRKDSILDNHHFNIMLQALSKTSGKERVQAFLNTRSSQLSNELLENASFNYELLDNPASDQMDFRIFALKGNSPQSDFSPAFYGDDRLLFSSTRPQEEKDTYFPTGEAYTDIFVAPLQADGQLGTVAPLNSLPPLKFHEATPFYSEALEGIFYVRSNASEGALTFDANGKNSLAIALNKRNGSFQTLLRDPSISFYYPFYEAENERLYFAADFQQGYGGTDLYYVVTNQGLIMSAPVNLGPRINTPGNEIAPFVVDGSLYFSSDVFYGLGGMDVFKSEMQADGTFSIPANLGPEINSVQDEFGFVIRSSPTGGYQGYFASNRPGGVGSDDLYGFTVSQKPGLRTLVVSGQVLATTGDAVEKARVRLQDASGGLLREVYTQGDGNFRIEIPWQADTRLSIDKERFTAAVLGGEGQVQLGEGEPVEVILKPVEEVVRQVRDHYELRGEKFYFQTGSSRLTDAVQIGLQEPLQALREFPELRIRIEAHTDSRGSSATNQALSQQRAEAIREYLVSNGIAADRIVAAEGKGESQILNNCTDGVYCLEVLHKQNERYPLIVTNYEER
ncbi:OmpA family protein [Robiginitalea sp. SC105]|uniref:OmpA family protein n=1 Tax=Robiginitalea sp. SC105 TaxID=2762332 RepID=UPI00163A6D68|nr:OmpA family protein [Robiginitalea sp. SC105]MBC2838815.1 OmpA family protein [Robiginitalea sp. SC105]